MMAESSQRAWALNVVSSAPVDSWIAAAKRLRDALDAISGNVAVAYGQPVTWLSQSLDSAGWADVERMAAEMERLINTDEQGRVWHELGALGTISGYLDGRTLISTQWSARHHESPMQVIADFKTHTTNGAARALPEHDPDWLADLLLDTAATMVRVSEGHISTNTLSRARRARDVRSGYTVGAVTYSPYPVDADTLPPTLRVARESPAGTAIVVKDLHRFASDPASLLDDLLALEQLIGTARATQ
jgi:hypothetical protein